MGLEADLRILRPIAPRRDRERHPRPEVRRGAQPSPLGDAFPPTLPGWPSRSWPTIWPAGPPRIGLGDPAATTKTLRRRLFSLAGPHHSAKTRRLTLHLPQGRPWRNRFSSALARIARPAAPFLTTTTASDPSAALPDCLVDLRQVGPRVSPAAICTLISPVASTAARPKSPSRR